MSHGLKGENGVSFHEGSEDVRLTRRMRRLKGGECTRELRLHDSLVMKVPLWSGWGHLKIRLQSLYTIKLDRLVRVYKFGVWIMQRLDWFNYFEYATNTFKWASFLLIFKSEYLSFQMCKITKSLYNCAVVKTF